MQNQLKEALSVVIPVYNEEKTIQAVLTGWHHSLKRLEIKHDIIVINDGSTDSTEKILQDLKEEWNFLTVITQDNAGHGLAVRHGLSIACSMENKYIFQTDSDHQFTPSDFDKFWNKREEHRAIFGHRLVRHDPAGRKFISGVLKRIIFGLYGVEIPDANIPYRLFERNYLRNILAVIPMKIFAPNIFISLVCHKSKKRDALTIPVTHFERPHGEAKLLKWNLIKACLDTFSDLFSFSYHLKKKIDFVEEKYRQDQSSLSEETQVEKGKEEASPKAA